jgi:hypothetical protein
MLMHHIGQLEYNAGFGAGSEAGKSWLAKYFPHFPNITFWILLNFFLLIDS